MMVWFWSWLGTLDDNYRWVEDMAIWAILYGVGFTVYTLSRMYRKFVVFGGNLSAKDNPYLSEINAAPITGMLTWMFMASCLHASVWDVALFVWWGCGFYVSVGVILWRARQHRIVDWRATRFLISVACKVCYVWLMVVFFRRGMFASMFTFSVWIINDQIGLAFMQENADRTRRTFDDVWLFRLGYPLGLFIPLWYQVPYAAWLAAYGLLLCVLWVAGLVYCARDGKFFVMPPSAATLRNMMYYDVIDTMGTHSDQSDVQPPKKT